MTKIPHSLQAVLWSRDVRSLDLKKNKTYIIHQILAYGTWEHLTWLFRTYPKAEIKKVFLKYPAKDYVPAAFHFVASILLDLKPETADEKRYVKTALRITE